MMRGYNDTKVYLNVGDIAWAHRRGRAVKVKITEVDVCRWSKGCPGTRFSDWNKFYWCHWVNPPKRLTRPALGTAMWRSTSRDRPWFPAACHFGHGLALGDELWLTRREAQWALQWMDPRYRRRLGASNPRGPSA